MNTTDPSRANGIRIFLWTLVGVASGIVAVGFLTGADLPTLPEVASPAFWIGLVAFLVMIAGLSYETSRGVQLPALKWVALLFLAVALAAGNAPILATLAQLGLTLGLVAAFSLVVFLLISWFGPKGRKTAPAVPRRNESLGLYVGGAWLSPAHVAAISLIIGIVGGVAISELAALETRVDGASQLPRTVEVFRSESAQPNQRLLLARAEVAKQGAEPVASAALMIDANLAGKVVLFDHAAHQRRQGDMASCAKCHHYNMRMAKGTSCAVCHEGFGEASRAFDHTSHVADLGGNESCLSCHPDDAPSKIVAVASCGQVDCHAVGGDEQGIVKDEQGIVKVAGMANGMAPSYVDAMHGLCIRCHKMEEARKAASEQYLSNCTVCHRLERSGPSEFGPDQLLLQPATSDDLMASHGVDDDQEGAARSHARAAHHVPVVYELQR